MAVVLRLEYSARKEVAVDGFCRRSGVASRKKESLLQQSVDEER